ncbi:MAG: extracellular solute-binding protein [Fuerstiella sp.]|nr:extracellular solute-binding protein [Fuerstiella sp.]MCP4858221.1 extracellular solute-binding protein [Fuerstiella sp.]
MLKSRSSIVPAASCILIVAALTVIPPGSTNSDSNTQQLVVYCAHDATHAESVVRRFETQTGISVDVRFDEEASKSLGLTNLLIAEQANPRCDVFWNNQTLGTIRLMAEDVLQPYVSTNADRIPDNFRNVDGYWTGFAARLRVYVVNTDHMSATQNDVATVLQNGSLRRVAIAQPLFGTTLSHYSVLMDQWGMERLKQWQSSIHERGIREVRGNSMTKDLVAEGICDIGFTDTDDAFAAIDDGMPVEMVPVRLEDGRTICLPNSVALIKDCPHPAAAKKFIDFLLSEESELLMANSSARQIPLGPVNDSQLSPELLQLKKWAADGVSLEGAARVNRQVLDWLTVEYTGR